jgi:uncharacterized protein (DUF58 family)
MMDTRELLRKVRRIEIKTKRLSSHLFSGEYHSSFKGRGMSFSEVRAYQYGDDIRSIDWNVTARLREPHVKIFEEERELTTIILADVSGSGNFGTRGELRKDVITEISATLAFSALQNNDKVGVLLFSDKVEKFIPPQKGRMQVLRIIRELLEFEPEGTQTSIANALEFLSAVQRKRGIAFLLSDFLDTDYHKELSTAARRHDLIGFRLKDPFEASIPKMGVVPMLDAESQTTHWINTSSKKVRKKFLERMASTDRYFEQSFRHAGADMIQLELGNSYAQALLKFFKQRNKR